MRVALGFLLAVWTLAGCKAGLRKEPDQGVPAVVKPKRMQAADAESAKGTALDLDAATGRIRSSLILRLDYFPDPKPGQTSLPTCFRPFPGDFDLGIAVCADDPAKRQPIYARNVDQDCYTDPNFKRVITRHPLVIPGCQQAVAVAHTFDPPLRLDVEVR